MSTTPAPVDESANLTERSIPECFATAVRALGTQPALSSRAQSFTYDALNRAANRLAHAILERTGPGRQPIVLMAERDAWAVVGMLAILKAGKICVPVQPDNHEDRMLRAVISEMQPPLVLAHGDRVAAGRAFEPAHTLDLHAAYSQHPDTDPAVTLGPADLALVIYTSGSTGVPKGVIHNHRNLLHRAFWYAQRFGVGHDDRTMMLSSSDHISGVVGVLRALVTGGRLHVLDLKREGFDGLVDGLRTQGSTILPMVNSVFRRFVDELDDRARFPSLRLVILGGEAPQAGDLARFRRHFDNDCVLLNTLGCTELPTYRYLAVERDTRLPDGILPAGHAVPGTSVRLIDADGREVDDGETGEIVVYSRYLALGYWNRPLETRQRFGFDAAGVRSYRTGDLGRLVGGDVLVHCGRTDWQVKILGNRVALTEVEDVLRTHPGVRDAAVAAWPDAGGTLRLYAYVVADPQPAATDLKAHVRAHLPDYMVPVEVLAVAALPLNRAGKLDRRALPDPRQAEAGGDAPPEPPRTESERRIARICCEVLGRTRIGVHDNIFDLGMNSLLAMQIVNRLAQADGRALPMTLPFQSPTVAGLATLLEGPDPAATAPR